MAEINTQTPKKAAGKLKTIGRKESRKWIVLCVLAVAAIGGAAAFMSRTKAKAAKAETSTTASVEKRSITNSSPAAVPCSRRFLHRYHAGVRRDPQRHLEEGDMVEKDQLLYTIDSSDVSTTGVPGPDQLFAGIEGQVSHGGHQRHRQRGLRQQRRRGERRDRTGEDQRQQ